MCKCLKWPLEVIQESATVQHHRSVDSDTHLTAPSSAAHALQYYVLSILKQLSMMFRELFLHIQGMYKYAYSCAYIFQALPCWHMLYVQQNTT